MKKYLEEIPNEDQFRDELPNIGIDRVKQREAYEAWMKKASQYIKKLEHHRDTTVGLWATDRPDLVTDTKKMLFEIKF